MTDKPYFIENRESWKNEYGSIFDKFFLIKNNIKLIEKYGDLYKKPLKILDVGCAYGYYMQVLKILNSEHKVYGIEIAKDPYLYCKKVFGENYVYWQSCSEKFPFKDSYFDLILCLDVIEHLSNTDEAVKMIGECKRTLKNDGLFLLRTPLMNYRTIILGTILGKLPKILSKDHKLRFNFKGLNNLVSPYFNVKAVKYGNSFSTNHMNNLMNFLKLRDMTLVMGKNHENRD